MAEETDEIQVVSDVGITKPPLIYKGDGVTPADAEPAPPKNAEPGPTVGIPEGEDPPEGSVISPAGITPPTIEYQGDGITPVGVMRQEKDDNAESEPLNYENFTVAELKGFAQEKGITIKSDWNKSQIIEALEEAD